MTVAPAGDMSLRIVRRSPAFFVLVALVACGSSGASSAPDAGDGGGDSRGRRPRPTAAVSVAPSRRTPAPRAAARGEVGRRARVSAITTGPATAGSARASISTAARSFTTGQGAAGAVCCGCPPSSDGGQDAQGDVGGSCPGAPPAVGSSCTAGLSCSYCDGGALCDCNAGQWECGGATSCLPGGGGG